MSREDILVELIGSIYYCSKSTIMVSNQLRGEGAWEEDGSFFFT